MSTSKRVFFLYCFTHRLSVFAAGIGNLLRLAVRCITISRCIAVGDVSFNREQFSFGTAMLIIGGLLWFFFWRYIQKQDRRQ